MKNSTPFLHQLSEVITLNMNNPPEKIINRLAGGFSAVYVTESSDPILPISVLKTPRIDLGLGHEILDIFANEATLWSMLPKHPNIVPLHNIWSYNERPYLRISYIEPLFPAGSSVAHMLASINPGAFLDQGTIIVFLTQILKLLADFEATVPGFYHGDIKPDNILVAGDPNIGLLFLLTDFGLGRAKLPYIRQNSHVIFDTRYVAPEILDGKAPKTQSEIYSFGCTAFEVMCGRKFNEIRNHGPRGPELKILGSAIPDGCFSIICDCLRENPNERPQTFRELQIIMWSALKIAGFRKGEDIYLHPMTSPSHVKNVSESPLLTYLINNRNLTEARAEDVICALSKATMFRHAGRFEEAEEILVPILTEIPDFPPALSGNAFGLCRQNKIQESLHIYLRAIKGYNADKQLLKADGNVFASSCAMVAQIIVQIKKPENEHLELALGLVKIALEFTPDHPQVIETRGMVEMRMGLLNDAIVTFSKAYALDPGNRKVRMNLVSALTIDAPKDFAKNANEYSLSDNEENSILTKLKGK